MPEVNFATYRQMAQETIKRIDRNGNGRLELNEFESLPMFRWRNLSATQVRRAFNALNTDHLGNSRNAIDVNELARFYAIVDDIPAQYVERGKQVNKDAKAQIKTLNREVRQLQAQITAELNLRKANNGRGKLSDDDFGTLLSNQSRKNSELNNLKEQVQTYKQISKAVAKGAKQKTNPFAKDGVHTMSEKDAAVQAITGEGQSIVSGALMALQRAQRGF